MVTKNEANKALNNAVFAYKNCVTQLYLLTKWLQKQYTLEHSFVGHFASVYESILDLRKFGELHPYMIDVSELPGTARNGIEYSIKEEVLLLGFLKMNPEYKAEVIEIEKNKHVQYISNVKGGIKLVIDFTFSHDENRRAVYVSEQINIMGNWFLIAYFSTILQKAHLQLFDNLTTQLTVSVS